MSNGFLSTLKTARDAALAASFTAVVAVLLAPVVQVSADNRHSAEVTILEGKAARVTEKGARTALEKGSTVFENELVETEPGSRVELMLKDKSVLRIGPASKLQLKSAYFGEKGEKKFTAKLMFGRVWSKVSGLVGGESKFEVETDNAVAGVRGTTFRVDAQSDRSVLVRVYAGSVAMAPGAALAAKAHTPGKRKQIGGPKQVTKAEWETIVGKMMQMAVSADGQPGEPTAFTEQDDSGDEWASWNRALDGE